MKKSILFILILSVCLASCNDSMDDLSMSANSNEVLPKKIHYWMKFI